MSRNGSGTYSLPAGNPVVTGTTISSTTMNTTLSDIATALTASIAADGQTPVTANIPMNTHKLTGLSAGTSSGDSLAFGQSAFGKVTLTQPAGGSTLTVADGKTLSTNNSLTLAGTDGTTITFPSATTTFAFGTYTPTLTAVTNVSASTPRACQYLRVGNTATVSGSLNLTATSAAPVELGISIPIASNFGNSYECAGTAAQFDVNYIQHVALAADAANNRAALRTYQGLAGVAMEFYFSFTYQVL